MDGGMNGADEWGGAGGMAAGMAVVGALCEIAFWRERERDLAFWRERERDLAFWRECDLAFRLEREAIEDPHISVLGHCTALHRPVVGRGPAPPPFGRPRWVTRV